MMINIYLKMWKCRYICYMKYLWHWDLFIRTFWFCCDFDSEGTFFNLIILTLKIPNNWKFLQESTQLEHNNTMLWNWIMVVVCSTSSMHTMYLGWGVVPVFLKKINNLKHYWLLCDQSPRNLIPVYTYKYTKIEFFKNSISSDGYIFYYSYIYIYIYIYIYVYIYIYILEYRLLRSRILALR